MRVGKIIHYFSLGSTTIMTAIEGYGSVGQVEAVSGGESDARGLVGRVPVRELLDDRVLDLLLEGSRDAAGQFAADG